MIFIKPCTATNGTFTWNLWLDMNAWSLELQRCPIRTQDKVTTPERCALRGFQSQPLQQNLGSTNCKSGIAATMDSKYLNVLASIENDYKCPHVGTPPLDFTHNGRHTEVLIIDASCKCDNTCREASDEFNVDYGVPTHALCTYIWSAVTKHTVDSC